MNRVARRQPVNVALNAAAKALGFEASCMRSTRLRTGSKSRASSTSTADSVAESRPATKDPSSSGSRSASASGRARGASRKAEHQGQRLQRRLRKATPQVKGFGGIADRVAQQCARTDDFGGLQSAQHGVLEQAAADAVPCQLLVHSQ